MDDFLRLDPETRLVMVGDASMAPYELMASDGSIYVTERSGKPSIDRLKLLAETFPHCVWLNPVPERMWNYTQTINMNGKTRTLEGTACREPDGSWVIVDTGY